MDTQARLDKINEHYCSADKTGNPIWKLASKRDEKFLLKSLKESKPGERVFSESAFFLGKFYNKKHKKVLQDALARAVQFKVFSAVYVVLISLDNIGESVFSPKRIRLNNDMTNWTDSVRYLKRVRVSSPRNAAMPKKLTSKGNQKIASEKD